MQPKRSLTGALAVFLAVTAAACTKSNGSGGNAAGGSGSGAATGNSAASGGSGGNLIVARPLDVVDLSPDGSFLRSSDSQIVALIADSLYRVDKNDKLQPAIAASAPTLSQDQLSWTIKLRSGVKFSDGTPLTSADVKFSLDNAKQGKQQGKLYQPISSIDTPDPSTVVIHTSTKVATLEWTLAGFSAAILPNNFEGKPAKDFYQQPIGAGAFMIAERKPGVDVKLVRNPNYYGTPAKLDSITFTPVADPNTRVTQLRAGTVNMIEDPPIQQVKQIKADSKLKIYSQPVGVMRLGLNTTKPPLNDVHVRRAISLALDRASMVQAVLGGGGGVACTWISTTFLQGYKSPFGCLTNLDQAKSELAKSSYAKGASFTLIYDGADAEMPLTAQIVQSNLAKIGIQVKLDGTTNQLYKAALANKSFQGRFSLFALPGDPGLSMANYLNTDAESTSAPVLPQIKQEYEQATQTFDDAARFKIYDTMVDQIAEDADAVALYSPDKLFASSAKVNNVVVLPTNKVDFADISMSK